MSKPLEQFSWCPDDGYSDWDYKQLEFDFGNDKEKETISHRITPKCLCAPTGFPNEGGCLRY